MRIATLLLMFCLGVFAFDINSFANQQKSTFLSNSVDVKTKVAPVVGYKDPNLNGGVDAYKDQNKTAAVLDLMNKTQGGNSWRYSCKDTRVIAEIEKWICSEDNFIYPKQALCEPNCQKQGSCKQADCYSAFACENGVCPINKVECTSSTNYKTPTCTAPAVWNSTTKKCETGGTATYAAPYQNIAFSANCWGNGNTDSRSGYYQCNGTQCINNWSAPNIFTGPQWYTESSGTLGSLYTCDLDYADGNGMYVYLTQSGYLSYNYDIWTSGRNGSSVTHYSGAYQLQTGVTQNIGSYSIFGSTTYFSITVSKMGGYTCNSGDTLSGTTCTHSTLVQTDGQCPTNYSLTNGQCVGLFYNCPSGGNTCGLSGDGKYYCSPYPCSTNSQNEQWCSADPIIGDGRAGFQCSIDGSWAITQNSCNTVCQFYKCQETSKTYTSNSECQTSCKQARPCTKY